PRRADRAPGRCRRVSRTNREDTKHIVVTGGGVVVGDDREQVFASDTTPHQVDTATHALASRATAAGCTAGGLVTADGAAGDGERRGAIVVQAAAEAVAAVGAGAAGPAGNRVAAERPAAGGEGSSQNICEAAAQSRSGLTCHRT